MKKNKKAMLSPEKAKGIKSIQTGDGHRVPRKDRRILDRALKNRVTIEDSSKLQQFYVQLNEYTRRMRISDIPLNISYHYKDGDTPMAFTYISGSSGKTKVCDSIKLYCEDFYNVSLTPHADGIEIERLEVYQTGRGIGSYLINIFNEISQWMNMPLYLVLGTPGYGNTFRKDADPKRRREFYHKHGFKRMKNSEYWKNTEVKEITITDICLNKVMEQPQLSEITLTDAEATALQKWMLEISELMSLKEDVPDITKLENIYNRRIENKIDPLLNEAIRKAFTELSQ